MKVKKALTLLPALLLVVGLGACNDSSNSDGGEQLVPRDDAAYTLSITITCNGEVQTVPDYASIYIEGNLMDPTDNWVGETFHELTPNGNTYEFYYDEMPAAGSYEFGVVLEAKGTDESEVGWSHKVNSGSGNEEFVVLGTEEYGYVNSVTVETSQPLSDLLPDPALQPATNVTFSASFSSGVSDGTNDVYLIGGFNNDNWTTWNKCTYNSDSSVWDFTFDTLALGTVSYQFVSTAAGVAPAWDDGTGLVGTVTQYSGDLSHTVTQEDSNTVISVVLPQWPTE